MSKEAMKLALETSEGIVNADWRKWDELASPEEFERWVKSRANHMVSVLRAALANEALERMAENARELGLDYDAKTDHCMMENAQGDLERIKLVQTGVGIGKPEPEFFTHCVDKPYDWSEWVCPDPKGYLMKCCDCGLVHEAEFGVVRYKSETEREVCDFVADTNLQAVFRMRRSEQWSPEDTAHRAGGLPMEQPAQQEPVAWTPIDQPYPPGGELDILMGDGSILCEVLPQSDGDLWWGGASTGERFIDPRYASVTHWRIHAEHTSPPAQRKPLTDEQWQSIADTLGCIITRGQKDAIEATIGIKENT